MPFNFEKTHIRLEQSLLGFMLKLPLPFEKKLPLVFEQYCLQKKLPLPLEKLPTPLEKISFAF